jgi:hypothetical protein
MPVVLDHRDRGALGGDVITRLDSVGRVFFEVWKSRCRLYVGGGGKMSRTANFSNLPAQELGQVGRELPLSNLLEASSEPRLAQGCRPT